MNHPIRILHLITDLGTGGAERFLIDLCQRMQADPEFDIQIGTLFPENQFPEETKGIKIQNLDYRTFRLFKRNEQPGYAKLLKEFQPDIIHSHRFLAEFLSAFHVNNKIAYVCHGHDNMVQLDNWHLSNGLNKSNLLNQVEKAILIRHKYLRSKTYFACNSNHTLTYFKNVLPGYLSKRILLKHLGFEYQRFYKSTENQLPTEGSPVQLINVGSYQKKKNQIFLLDVAAILKQKNVDFQMHLIGRGSELEKVRNKARAMNLDNRVIFHPHVVRVADYLHQSHLYLHAATYEPFGLVFLEAMAAGLPCISLDGKGNRDLIENGKNGFMLDGHKAEQFADRVIELIGDPVKYADFSRHGKEFAKRFEMTTVIEEWKSFYKDILIHP